MTRIKKEHARPGRLAISLLRTLVGGMKVNGKVVDGLTINGMVVAGHLTDIVDGWAHIVYVVLPDPDSTFAYVRYLCGLTQTHTTRFLIAE